MEDARMTIHVLASASATEELEQRSRVETMQIAALEIATHPFV